MKTIIKIRTTFSCSLEAAFKAPMLFDPAKFHTGYGIMPGVTHCLEDGDWGQVHSTKRVYAAKTFIHPGGYVSMDKILEREDLRYWKFEVYDFRTWFLSFYKFTAEWETMEKEPNLVQVDYTYTLHSRSLLLYPLNWLFGHLFWRRYMQHVLEKIRDLIDQGEPYKYAY